MSALVKIPAVLLVVLLPALVAYGFISGKWMGGLLYAGMGMIVLYEWWTLRKISDESRFVADRMFWGEVILMFFIARPALEYLEALAFG